MTQQRIPIYQTIGRVEKVDFPDIGVVGVPAKIDTGAESSSVWVTSLKKTSTNLQFCLFGPGYVHYTSKIVTIPLKNHSVTRIVNSFGKKQLRYKIKLNIRIKKRLVHATVTLSDRSSSIYPVLIGRRLLRAKFLVDVSRGTPLKHIERVKKKQLQSDLNDTKHIEHKG